MTAAGPVTLPVRLDVAGSSWPIGELCLADLMTIRHSDLKVSVSVDVPDGAVGAALAALLREAADRITDLAEGGGGGDGRGVGDADAGDPAGDL